MLKRWLFIACIVSFHSIADAQALQVEVVAFHPQLNNIVAPGAKFEVLAEGLNWTEGPLWLEKSQVLLFSDIPSNSIYKWTKRNGMELYLTPSGYTDAAKRGGETGSNGLLLNNKNQLVLCQHGDRRIALMDAPILQPKPQFITLANSYNGKKFDSPNDAVYHSNGDLFFTDPPYGLERNFEDPKKEAPYNGVYKLDTKGKVSLLIDSITRPNGIALFPDQKRLLIANSDPEKPYWYLYELDEAGALVNGKIFYDATAASKQEPGMPDGMKIDTQGNIFATGPGGVWIFNKDGVLLGKIKVNDLTSNCTLSKDWIYITANKRVIRVQLAR